MLFNSYGYIFLFLPISFFIYFYLNSKSNSNSGKIFLVLTSLFFYSWWNIVYLPLILLSMLFNYKIGNILSSTKDSYISKKQLLGVGVVFNVSLLGYFKYSDFFIENFNTIFDSNVDLLSLALPLAISFFTFQQIAYLVDSYKLETNHYDFFTYAVFVSFFPQLIAGPIVHHKEMMPQFENRENRLLNYRNISLGLFIFSIGLFKKVIIADTFSIWVANGFDKAVVLTLFEAWATSLSYTFQIYFDFSGYTDMAIGSALLFNIKLPINFNSPYKATSIQDFWRRWHMTLSRFLGRYIYVPLGGNRRGKFRTYYNLFIVFLVTGFWHGAGWGFVVWGILHGIAMIIQKIWEDFNIKLNIIFAWFITFNFVNFSRIFFRANDFDDAFKVIKGMLGVTGVVLPTYFSAYLDIDGVSYGNMFGNIFSNFEVVLWLIGAFIIVLMFKNSNELLDEFKATPLRAVIVSVIFFIAVINISGHSEFLYFRF